MFRKARRQSRHPNLATRTTLALFALLTAPLAVAADLAPDRADVLYHRYEGGGATIDGPAVLVRKRVGKQWAVQGKYYVDSISSASVDVIATASPYTEERTEWGLGVEYLRGSTTVSAGASNSEENDFTGNSAYLSVSQDIFGALTTITMTYAIGDDEVRRRGDENFSADADRQLYGIDISQIVTKKFIMGLAYEAITDEGFLNNPYRQVRYLDSTSATGYSYQPERYPNTRTSNAVSLRGRYYLDHRAAIHGQYRYFSDTWDIRSHTAEVGYTHTIGDDWILELKLRAYRQDQAEFYSDLFDRVDQQNFLARDKEMSTFDNNSLRVGITYEFAQKGWGFINRGSVNFNYDYIDFSYDNFRDVTQGGPVGEEPLYGFSADVITAYVSFWY